MLPSKTDRRGRPVGRLVPFTLGGLLAAVSFLFILFIASAPALAVVSGDFVVSEGGQPVGEARVSIVVQDDNGEERKVGGSIVPSGEDGEARIAIDDDARGRTATVIVTKSDGSTTRIPGFRIPWENFADYNVFVDTGTISHALWFTQSQQIFTDIRGDWMSRGDKLRLLDSLDSYRLDNPFQRHSWTWFGDTDTLFLTDGMTLLDDSPDKAHTPYFQFDSFKTGPDGIPSLTFTIYTESFAPGTATEFFRLFSPDLPDSAFLPDGIAGTDPTWRGMAGFRYRGESFYVNDRWRLNDHWSFNLGQRYEDLTGNRVNAPADGEAPVQDFDSEWKDFAPRVGVTYALGADRRTHLRISITDALGDLPDGPVAAVGPEAAGALGDKALQGLTGAEPGAAGAGEPVREYEGIELIGRYRLANRWTLQGDYILSAAENPDAPAGGTPNTAWILPMNPRLDGFTLRLGQTVPLGLGDTFMLRDLGQRTEQVIGVPPAPQNYINVDYPVRCDYDIRATGNFFGGPANNANILWGDYYTIDPADNVCGGTALVPIEPAANGAYYDSETTYYGGYYTNGFDAGYTADLGDAWKQRFIAQGPFIEPLYGARGEIPAGARATKPAAAVSPPPAFDRLPSDPYFHARGSWGQDYDDQWGLKRIGFAATGRDGKGTLWPKKATPVLVAVVDSGLDVTHPDLRGALWANFEEIPNNGKDDDGNGLADDFIGWNFVNDSKDIRDTNGHGTVVAGIIAAGPDNALGIAGVNPWARILPVKVTDYDNTGNSVDAAKGIAYAARMGARVINVSIGTRALSRVEQAAVNYATREGALVVVAAGNQGVDTAAYSPAGLDGVITVAATGPDDAREPYSNWGANVDIAAPGRDILSLRAIQTDLMLFAESDYQPGTNMVGRDRNYYRVTGTSFAAPFVSGVASLILAADPALEAEQVRRMILHSARDVETPGFDQYTGYGLVDARAAVTADPGFFIDSRIARAAAAQADGGVVLEVTGTADADSFARAWIEAAPGERATEGWTKVSGEIAAPVRDAALARIAPEHLQGAKVWTLRLVVEHENGRTREARFVLRLG